MLTAGVSPAAAADAEAATASPRHEGRLSSLTAAATSSWMTVLKL